MVTTDPQRRQKIIDAVSKADEAGITVSEIVRQVGLERHTLSKYLSLLNKEGVLDYRPVGRTRLWSLNKDPFRSILEKDDNKRSFAENLLLNILRESPVGMLILDHDLKISFANKNTQEVYGDVIGEYPEKLLKNADGFRVKIKNSMEKNKTKTYIFDDIEGRKLEVSISGFETPSGREAMIMLHDITSLDKTQ